MPPPIKEVTTKTIWWKSQLNVQTLIAVGTAIVFCVGFVLQVKSHDSSINKNAGEIEELKKFKADKAETDAKMKSLEERFTRQYEQIGKQSERITAIEKELEYERGVHDATDKLTKTK